MSARRHLPAMSGWLGPVVRICANKKRGPDPRFTSIRGFCRAGHLIRHRHHLPFCPVPALQTAKHIGQGQQSGETCNCAKRHAPAGLLCGLFHLGSDAHSSIMKSDSCAKVKCPRRCGAIARGNCGPSQLQKWQFCDTYCISVMQQLHTCN